MVQVPQEIWNEIAKTGMLQTDWAKKMFNLTEQEINLALEKEGNELESLGYSNKVIISYLAVKPLLLEHRAISAYLTKTNQIQRLHPSLPEILSPQEAEYLMRMEYRLTKEESKELITLLKMTMEGFEMIEQMKQRKMEKLKNLSPGQQLRLKEIESEKLKIIQEVAKKIKKAD